MLISLASTSRVPSEAEGKFTIARLTVTTCHAYPELHDSGFHPLWNSFELGQRNNRATEYNPRPCKVVLSEGTVEREEQMIWHQSDIDQECGLSVCTH